MSNSNQLMSLIPNGSIIRRDGDNYTLSAKGGSATYMSLPDEDINKFLDRTIATFIYMEARGCGKTPILNKFIRIYTKTSK